MTATPERAEVVTPQQVVAGLARVKALFQERTIAAVLGVPAPAHLTETDR